MSGSPDITEVLKMLTEFLPLLIPVLIVEWVLLVYALIKLLKSELPPKYFPKWAWILIIIFINLLGPIAYLIFGRNEE